MRVRYCDCTTDDCLIHRLGSTDWQTRGLPVEADFDAFEEFLGDYETHLFVQTKAKYSRLCSRCGKTFIYCACPFRRFADFGS